MLALARSYGHLYRLQKGNVGLNRECMDSVAQEGTCILDLLDLDILAVRLLCFRPRTVTP